MLLLGRYRENSLGEAVLVIHDRNLAASWCMARRCFSLHPQNGREYAMSSQNKRDQLTAANPNRRSILLGSTTLAATTALGSGLSIQVAQAQQPSSPALG